MNNLCEISNSNWIYIVVESEYLSDEVLEDTSEPKKRSVRKNLQKKFHKHREQRNSVESDDTEIEDPNLYDSQDDNEDDSEHMADLMAASTTIKWVLFFFLQTSTLA